MDVLSNPGFFITYAVLQGAVVLFLIRSVDPFHRQPLGAVALVAVWGATGAALLALLGNEAVKQLLSGDAQVVFGDAVSAPIVEESAKGLALVAVVLASGWAAKRMGILIFGGVTDGIVFGAAVGLGFAFTEDFFYFVQRAREQGLDSAADLLLTRRDFFGPAMLHHPLFSAALGAGLGLAVWASNRLAKYALVAGGLLVAILMHAVNNGFIELALVLKHGLATTAIWEDGGAVSTDVKSTADSASAVLHIVDYVYIAMFIVLILLWTRRQRRVVASELLEEVENGLIDRKEMASVLSRRDRFEERWRHIRTGQFEQWNHRRRLYGSLADLALLKSRTRTSNGDWERVKRERRQIATLRAFEPRETKLPIPSTPLIGRSRELSELAELLRNRDVRLVTLVGTGGAGKTRLAAHAAAEVADAFASGVYFIGLAPVLDEAVAVSEVTRTLGVREAGEEPLARLKDYLRDKSLLLVLDNLEQLATAGSLVADLLVDAPSLKILATSRASLHVSGEHRFEVPPLALPDPEQLDDFQSVARCESVALFFERAKSVDSSFTLNRQNARSIADICLRLDGLPLALELAAARVNVLSVDMLVDRLGSRLDLLSQSTAVKPERQQTLRATLDWSYELLSADERALFADLSVFAGGFRLESAEDVCRGDLDRPVLDYVQSLLDASLLTRTLSVRHAPRFQMLETVREYARERQSDSNHRDVLRTCHAKHFLDFALGAQPWLEAAEQLFWTQALEEELENLRAALKWSFDSGQSDLGLGLATALGLFWERGRVGEGRKWLAIGLRSTGGGAGGAPGDSYRVAGRLAALQGDYDEANKLLERARSEFSSENDTEGFAESLAELAWIALVRGDYERSEELWEQTLEQSREIGDTQNVARALTTLARVLAETGRRQRAKSLAEEGLALRRELGDQRNVANSLTTLGRIALLDGHGEEAKPLLEQSLALARELDDRLREAEALYFLALVALEAGTPDKATPLLAERLELCRELGDRLGVAECLDAIGGIVALRGDGAGAAKLFGGGDGLRESIGASAWRFEHARRDRLEAIARQYIDEVTFGHEKSEGRAMTLDQAVSSGLENLERLSQPV
jgi:predicted ATPase/RsiW-degrading membrane proteinase PrsW (M82 family)